MHAVKYLGGVSLEIVVSCVLDTMVYLILHLFNVLLSHCLFGVDLILQLHKHLSLLALAELKVKQFVHLV